MKRGPALSGVALLVLGCWNAKVLPTRESAPPAQGTGSLMAGFGRGDITPPPGVGLAGNGPEGNVSTGYRHRLYARALVMQDPDGERIALVTLDQAHVSANLHRLAAESLYAGTGIGADRLIISATHTHSGSSHFYAEKQINGQSSRLAGYDDAVVALLVRGIVRAVRHADSTLRPAKAGWGFQRVMGYTRNRSYAKAYCLNPPAVRIPCFDEPGGHDPDPLLRSVDTEWKLLRVDILGDDGGYHPAGAYSVFAIHGTANPTVTTLLDGDIHAVVERRLEYLIDQANGLEAGYVPHAVHVFANGTEGDTSPNRPDDTQCPLPRLRSPPFAGPRAAPAPWIWRDASADTLAKCFAAARRFIDTTGRILGDSAFANFTRLEGRLSGGFTIRRAFATLPLKTDPLLCHTALVGSATVAGASDVPTRVAGWRLLGAIAYGFEQGGSAIIKPRGCQAQKRILLGFVQGIANGAHGLPEVAQVSLVRLGDVFLATVPAEPTTIAGRLIRDAMEQVVSPAVPKAHIVVVALTNGFMQYVTTRAEYAGQTYEGGSTIYGPGEAEFFATHLAELGRALVAAGPHSPPVVVGPITAYPGGSVALMARPSAKPVLVGARRLIGAPCLAGNRLRVMWLDEPPGRLMPSEGQVLEIQAQGASGWTAVAWDDQDDVVVEAVGKAKDGFKWSVTVSRPGFEGRMLRLRLLAGHGQQEFVSDSFTASSCR